MDVKMMWIKLIFFGVLVIESIKSQTTDRVTISSLDELIQIEFKPKCPEGERCVYSYNCINSTLPRNPDPLGTDDTRECYQMLYKCCPISDIRDAPIIPPSIVANEIESCGNRYEEGIGFQITSNKNEAQYGEFPWMVSILKVDTIGAGPDTHISYQCGGSLIHSNVILTAAHCVGRRKPEQLKIRIGEWDTLSESEIYPPQDLDVIEIVKHPNYNSGSKTNDIALLVLAHPVKISPVVQTACLPPQNYNFANSKCFVTGWGEQVYGARGQYSAILKKINLPIVAHNQCETSLRLARQGPSFTLHESFVCAGGEDGKDACYGDGGSPLVCPIPNENSRYYQVGIVSWGVGCGESEIPGVYTNVALYRNWIDQKFQERNINSNSYKYIAN